MAAAHQRKTSTTEGLTKTPHLVSLKVLRLSRPRLAQQFPLPPSDPGRSKYDVPIAPSLSLPTNNVFSSSASTGAEAKSSGEEDANGYIDHQFALTPLLSLPPAFGSTYVGETFACTLCANNELRGSASDSAENDDDDGKAQEGQKGRRSITGVRMAAEMQTPSNPSGIPLSLGAASSSSSSVAGITTDEAGIEVDKTRKGRRDENSDTSNPVKEQDAPVDLGPGETLLRTVHFDLREPGTHYLAVTITYDERQQEEGEGGQIVGARVRSFRKLYQFVAQTLLGIRTKAGEITAPNNASKGSLKKEDERRKYKRFALEAQIENMGDVAVVLEGAEVNPKAPFTSQSLNWDADPLPDIIAANRGGPTLNPHDVVQVAFVLEETDESSISISHGDTQSGITGKQLASGDEKTAVTLGQLNVRWRGPMGEKGSLKTGWLTGQKA